MKSARCLLGSKDRDCLVKRQDTKCWRLLDALGTFLNREVMQLKNEVYTETRKTLNV